MSNENLISVESLAEALTKDVNDYEMALKSYITAKDYFDICSARLVKSKEALTDFVNHISIDAAQVKQ